MHPSPGLLCIRDRRHPPHGPAESAVSDTHPRNKHTSQSAGGNPVCAQPASALGLTDHANFLFHLCRHCLQPSKRTLDAILRTLLSLQFRDPPRSMDPSLIHSFLHHLMTDRPTEFTDLSHWTTCSQPPMPTYT
ncbi:unnamed protein product [Periconia digitata]|uniref:Uncharacterized protein n=1 Tax=Periconia digitata TaxID=1303443 RepID=A0A9W4US51_9PLEO|nr:unnamed protein product [Periconia digitata]